MALRGTVFTATSTAGLPGFSFFYTVRNYQSRNCRKNKRYNYCCNHIIIISFLPTSSTQTPCHSLSALAESSFIPLRLLFSKNHAHAQDFLKYIQPYRGQIRRIRQNSACALCLMCNAFSGVLRLVHCFVRTEQ